MKRLCIVLVVIASCCELVAAQDLPPEILADQYLLEATEALENGDVQNAVLAFQKIEELAIKPPLEYLFLYGKLLVEHRIFSHDELLKGQSLLKKYILSIKRDSEHYKPTLQLLSSVGPKLEAAKRIKIRLKTLRADGVDINAKDKHGYTPLHRAIRSDSLEVVKALITAGVGVNAKSKLGFFNNYKQSLYYANGFTPLHFAAYTSATPEVVKVLIAAGADVNAKAGDGRTPLQVAAYNDAPYGTPEYALFGATPEVVKALIAAGADVKGGTLSLAISRCYNRMSYRRTSSRPRRLSPPLAEDTEVVKVLIAAGADAKDTYLQRAVSTNYTEVVKALIAAGADVNYSSVTKYGENISILCDAVADDYKTDRAEVIRVLVAAGANVNHLCWKGQRPLDFVGEWEGQPPGSGNWVWKDWIPEIATILRAAGAKSAKTTAFR